jgi:AsmA-like protein
VKLVRAAVLTGLAVVLLVGGAAALAAWRLDPEPVRAATGAQLARMLGRPVTLGPARLTLFPLAVSIRDAAIELDPERHLAIDELRFELSPLALLAGEKVLRSLDVEGPRVLPGRVAGPTWSDSAGLVLAPARIRVQRGTLPLAGHEVSGVSATLTPSSGTAAQLSAELPGLARIEKAEVELLGGPGAGWRARGLLTDVDLEKLPWTKSLSDLWGSAGGSFALGGHGGELESGELRLESADLNANGSLVHATGRVRLTLDFSDAFLLDLTGATVKLAGVCEKPPGTPLRVNGHLTQPLEAGRIGDLRIESDALRATGALDLAARSLALTQGALDLGKLAAWAPASWLPRSGAIELGSGRVTGAPLVLDLAGTLREVAFPVKGVTLGVSGPASAHGTTLASTGLRVALAGEEIRASGEWDWQAAQLHAVLVADGARIGPVAKLVFGHSDVSGRLYGRLELAGPADPMKLEGPGEFELLDGELPNVSIARTAGLIETLPEPPGLDEFDRLSGHFRVSGDKIQVSDLILVQKYATASVVGEIELPDGYANLTGATLMNFPELHGPSLRPILRMAGPWYALETHISNARTADEVRVERATVEAIRKAEKEQRERKRATQ